MFTDSSKQLFLKGLKISHENTCDGVFFNKVAGSQNCNFYQKEPLTQVFSSEF